MSAEAAGRQGVLLYRIEMHTGLGHVLISLLNAAAVARAYGRAFAIDARGFQYFPERRHEQFLECFALEAPDALPIVTDLEQIAQLSSGDGIRFINDEPGLRAAREATEPVLLLQATMLTEFYPLRDKVGPARFRIGLRGWLAERMQPVLDSLRDDPPAVGLYFRHGNGEFLHGRFDAVVFNDFEAQLRALEQRYAEQARELATQLGIEQPRYFVASDNAGFVARMQEMLPGAFSLARNLPDRDYKQHLRYSQATSEILFEAVQDVWALSACRSMLASSSLFARFAALNSATLTEAEVFDIAAPRLTSRLETLPPEEALAQARYAYDAQPDAFTGRLLIAALRRVGAEDEIARLQRRVDWWVKGIKTDHRVRSAQVDADAGRYGPAIERLREIDVAEGPNPYLLQMMAIWMMRDGDRDGAVATLRRAVAADDGINSINALLARFDS